MMRQRIDDSRLKPAPGLLAIVLVLPIVFACDQAPTEIRNLDLIVTKSLRSGGERLQAREVLHADETWVAVTVAPGSPVSAQIDVFSDPVLILSGGLDCGIAATPLEGSLRGSVKTPAGSKVSIDLSFESSDGWRRHEVSLDPVANASATLALESDVPEECSLHLREATLRQRSPRPETTEGRPTQILLISVDTLRADAVGAFGSGAETPHLDRLAGEAEGWPRHYAAASWTKPSHATMLTGYHPDTHRALLLDHAMDPAISTLAERFRDAGFTTAALVYDCTWLSPRWGFAKGFDAYSVTRWRAERQAMAAAEWVLDHRSDDFFFFLHTFEPHSDMNVLPYEAPGLNRGTIAERFGVPDYGCRAGLCSSAFLNALGGDAVPIEAHDREVLRSTYDAGVGYLDASLGALFEVLRSSGAWDRMLVVVTSDHGEEFMEHGGFSHGTLHDEILRVPLLIKWPGGERAGSVDETATSSIDLAPTLLESAGLPRDDLPGVVLGRRPAGQPVFAGTLTRAVVAGGFKGIFGGPKGSREVYDLAEDPSERHNLAASNPGKAAELEELLAAQQREAWALFGRMSKDGGAREVQLSEQERDRLKAFGYVDGGDGE